MSINQRIKELIANLKLSQNKFAISLDTTQQTINNIVTEKYNPSFEILSSILVTYNYVNPAWLLTGIGEMFLSEKKSVENSSLNEPESIYKIRHNSVGYDIDTLNRILRERDKRLEELSGENYYLKKENERLKKLIDDN